MKKAKFIKNWRMLSLTIPKDADYIDVVTTDKFPLGSILIRFKNTGLYALLNNGAISSCNQSEAEQYVKAMGMK